MNAGLVRRSPRAWTQIAWLLPVWAAAVLWLLDRSYFAAVDRNPPEAIGMPAGLVLLAVAAGIAVLGVLTGRASRSRAAAAAAFLFLTLPATLIVIVAPAVVTSLISLSPQTG